MAESTDTPDWRARLERCGLRFVGPTTSEPPPVLDAVYAVTGVGVKPAATIPAGSADAAEELDRQWHDHASQISLYTETGAFLILPPGPDGSGIGWVQVTDPVGSRLPSRVGSVVGSPELVAMTVDGRRLCAVSVEDDDFWVAVREFF